MFSLREKRDALLFFLKLIFGLNIFSRLLFTNRFRSPAPRAAGLVIIELSPHFGQIILADSFFKNKIKNTKKHPGNRAEMFFISVMEIPT